MSKVQAEDYRNAEWLRQKYWGENLSLREIGGLVNRNVESIRYWMIKFNISTRSKSEAQQGRKCPQRGRRGEKNHNWGKHLSLEARQKISNARRGKHSGEEHYRWKGGRRYDSKGYILLLRPGRPNSSISGHVYEHRLVVEEALGRYLKSDERVHHINGIKDDNRLENLELVDHHRRQVCPRCGWPMGDLKLLA